MARERRTRRPLTLEAVGRNVLDAARRHHLLTYSSAVAFRALVALIPLVLLGFALLGAFGLEDVWRDSLAPRIEGRVSPPVFAAIDYSVEKIFSSGALGLIAFGGLLALWDLALAVRTIMEALNEIHDVDESRSLRRRAVTAVALAAAIGICLVAAVLVIAAGPRLADSGAVELLARVGSWTVGVSLLGLAVGLLVRYTPAERPEAAWASAGTLLVLAVWVVTAEGFRLWVRHVADFESAVGSLSAFLILTAFVWASSGIFLIGAELDELLRKETGARPHGVVEIVRALASR
jgi:YihY family inner membrane protein